MLLLLLDEINLFEMLQVISLEFWEIFPGRFRMGLPYFSACNCSPFSQCVLLFMPLRKIIKINKILTLNHVYKSVVLKLGGQAPLGPPVL